MVRLPVHGCNRIIGALALLAVPAFTTTSARAGLPVPTATVSADATVPLLGATDATSQTLTASLTTTVYVRFHVDQLPIPPQRALLRLKVTDATTQDTTVTYTPSTWEESTITQANAPASAGGTVATGHALNAGQYAEYDVTSVVSAPGDVTLKIVGGLDGASFASRESATPPELVVTAKAPREELAYRLSTPPPRSDAIHVRYQATDSAGGALDGLKIVPDSVNGGYLGVWHADENGRFVARVGTSSDLLHWQRRADIDDHAGQPTLALLPGGGALVVEEADGDVAGTHFLRFRRYPTVAALLAAQPDASYDALRTLAPTAEGTPSIHAVDAGAQHIDVGFHYFRNVDVDRQATGHLEGMTSWTAQIDQARNTLFETLPAPVAGNLGDRDDLRFRGHAFSLQEGQLKKGDFGSWREYLYDADNASVFANQPLAIKTTGLSPAFGNGTATPLLAPSGKLALAVTYFVFGQGAASNEPGELIFFSEYDDGPLPDDAPQPTTVPAATTPAPPPPPVTTVATPPAPPPLDLAAISRAIAATINAVVLPTVHGAKLLARSGRYRFSVLLPAGEALMELWSARPPATGRAQAAKNSRPVVIAAQAHHVATTGAVRFVLKPTAAGRRTLRKLLAGQRSLVLRAVVTPKVGAQVTRDRRVKLTR
jgi:hypothetical protein